MYFTKSGVFSVPVKTATTVKHVSSPQITAATNKPATGSTSLQMNYGTSTNKMSDINNKADEDYQKAQNETAK